MVICYLNGQAGNNLFQYFLSYLVAKEKEYKVEFRYRNKQDNSFKMSGNFFTFNGIKLPSNIEGKKVDNNYITFNAHEFDWEKAIDHKGGIVIDGYFQNYCYYKDNKEIIKKFILKHNEIFKDGLVDNNDLTIHLRLKRYPYPINKLEFYESIIKSGNYNNIWLVTDLPSHSLVKHLVDNFEATIVNSNHFLFLCNSKNIILSQSTFSWWASFISEANEVYYPVFDNEHDKGIWYETPKRNINLYIGDRHNKIII